MDAPIHTILGGEASAHPVQAILLAVFLCLTTAFLVIRQILLRSESIEFQGSNGDFRRDLQVSLFWGTCST
jgi:hypothetical protein